MLSKDQLPPSSVLPQVLSKDQPLIPSRLLPTSPSSGHSLTPQGWSQSAVSASPEACSVPRLLWSK